MAIQFKRGVLEFDPSNSEIVLCSGQPFYSEKSQKLYIGDGTSQLKNLKGTVIGLNLCNGTGKYSTAGDYGTAQGMCSIAAGGSSSAYGRYSVALGHGCRAGYTEEEFNAKYPYGMDGNGLPATEESTDPNIMFWTDYRAWSVALQNSIARGRFAFATGNKNESNGNGSFTTGESNIVNGNCATALGSGNKIGNSSASFVSGQNNVIGDNAVGSAVFGWVNENNSPYSMIVGKSNLQSSTSGYQLTAGISNNNQSGHSVIFGEGNKLLNTNGHCSFIAGNNNISTSGNRVSLIGTGLTSNASGQVVVGEYNSEYNDATFIVGSGTVLQQRNSLVVTKSGNVKSLITPVSDNDVLRWQEKISIDNEISAVEQTIEQHKDNTSNPHNVTKAQIGLPNVVDAPQTASRTYNSSHYFTSGGAYTLYKDVLDRMNHMKMLPILYGIVYSINDNSYQTTSTDTGIDIEPSYNNPKRKIIYIKEGSGTISWAGGSVTVNAPGLIYVHSTSTMMGYSYYITYMDELGINELNNTDTTMLVMDDFIDHTVFCVKEQ